MAAVTASSAYRATEPASRRDGRYITVSPDIRRRSHWPKDVLMTRHLAEPNACAVGAYSHGFALKDVT
jgi:hypothetical protein